MADMERHVCVKYVEYSHNIREAESGRVCGGPMCSKVWSGWGYQRIEYRPWDSITTCHVDCGFMEGAVFLVLISKEQLGN